MKKIILLSLALMVPLLSAPLFAQSVNVAISGTASQSSTGFGGVAGYANDGNRSGRYNDNSVSHTALGAGEWWEVDLGSDIQLNEILVFNRTDCCENRIVPFRLSVFDGATEVYGVDVATFTADITGTNVSGMTFNGLGVVGDRIRVSLLGSNYLHLAEVEAWDVPTYSVGGSVSELSGSVTLQNNAGDDLTLSSDGAFTFPTDLADTSTYAVTVLTQPATQTCSITNGSGTLAGADVNNITLTCAVNTYSVGGSVSRLSGSITLQNNADDDLTLSSDGAFAFPTTLADTSAYAVTILTQPAGQNCSLTNGSGSLSGSNVSNVDVTCAAIQPAAAVPTLTTYGLVMTILGLLLVANRRLQVLSRPK